MVDWIPSGDTGVNNPRRESLVIAGAFGNFGDGNAHRASVWIQRGPQYKAERVTTSPLLKPGDALPFEATVRFDCLDESVLYLTWTPAPLRRRNEHTSEQFRVLDAFPLTKYAKELVQTYRDIQGQVRPADTGSAD